MDIQKRLLDLINIKKKIESYQRKYSNSLEPEINQTITNAQDSIQDSINFLK